MISIANIVGARPQFIKYCPISRAIARHNQTSAPFIRDILIHTGQHYDYLMSRVFFEEFGIRDPDYHLGVGSGPHGKQTGQIMERVEAVLEKEAPDFILVYGDTNSTMGGALAGAKLHIPVVHVEAGLRSYNKYMPEEINRVLTDHVSSVLLCPSQVAVKNLFKEGFRYLLNEGDLIPCGGLADELSQLLAANQNSPLIINVGDIMYDVLIYAVGLSEDRLTILDFLNLAPKSYCLLTLHRAENTDSPTRFGKFIQFVNTVSGGRPVIFPIHPRTKKILDQAEPGFSDNVRIIEPLGYLDMADLLKNSSLVLTDSGGLQKEAYWLEVPCITLRDETEWLETVESGWNILYRDYHGFHQPKQGQRSAAYGDGNSAERIVKLISIIGRNLHD